MLGFNPVSGIQLAKNHPLLPPAEIIVAFIWADLHNGDAPVLPHLQRRSTHLRNRVPLANSKWTSHQRESLAAIIASPLTPQPPLPQGERGSKKTLENLPKIGPTSCTMKIHLDSPAEEARIEIVPLIDVIFCILTFFILAALQLTRQQAITVDLPKASTGQPQVRNMLLVSVSALGQVYVEQTPVFSADQLTQAVRDYRALNPTGLMVLYASKDAKYNDVVQVLDRMREVGGDRVALATLPGAEVKPAKSNPLTPVIPGVPNLTLPPSVSPAAPLNPPAAPKSGTTFDPGKMQVPVVPGQLPSAPAPAVPAPGIPAPAIPAPPAGAGGPAGGAQ